MTTIPHLNSQLQHPSIVKKFTETKSVAFPSSTEIYGEIGLDIGGGIDIPFVANAKADLKTKFGVKHNFGTTVTNTVSGETNIVIPRQVVKCPPKKTTEMAFNFYSSDNTVTYSVDLEIDVNKSYVGFLQVQVIRNGDGTISIVRYEMVRHCNLMNDVSLTEETYKKIRVIIKNGKYIYKDLQVEVNEQSYEGNIKTQEKDLD